MTGDRHILIVMLVGNGSMPPPSVLQAVITTGYDLLVVAVAGGGNDQWFQSIADLPCRSLHLLKPLGHGAAILKGAEEAARLGYDSIVAINGDGRHMAEDIHLLVAKAQDGITPCLVIGTQRLHLDTVQDANLYRKTSGNFWVRLACGLEIPDVDSNFRLYPVKELLALNLARSHCGFARETIIKLAWSGLPIYSVPVSAGGTPAAKTGGRLATIGDSLSLTLLHSQLVGRRLLPWPHKQLTQQEPFPRKVYKSISKNPLKVLGEICREHNAPPWLAAAVWLGIFMGALPLLAIHTIAIIYVAHRLHMNKVAAVAASQFCMPPVVPVLCIQLGYYLRNGTLLVDFSWQPWLLGMHQRLWEWFIGSLFVGPFLGCIGAGIMYCTARRLQKRASE